MKAIEIIREAGELRQDVLSQILNPALIELRNKFLENRFDIRIVGGAVRDILSNKTPKDIDLCTDATPEEQIAIYQANSYRYIETGLQHGTVTVVIDKEPYEITSLRTESNHDGRHATVAYTRDWNEDLSRRDLTVNAMALTFDGELLDPFGGEKDLKSRTVKFVGDPTARITEDYLRILRFFRFHGRIGNNSYDPTVEAAIKQTASGLSKLSGERIWMEMSKILVGPNAANEIKEMYKLGVAQVIGLPDSGNKSFNISLAKTPITIMAYIVDDVATAQAISSKWKMSSQEFKLFHWLVANKQTNLTPHHAEDLVIDGINSSWVYELAVLQNKQNIATHITSWSPPVFPVSGADLQALGMKPGVEFGNTLKQLKDQWKKSRFKLTKEQLLAQIGKQHEKSINTNTTDPVKRMQPSS